MGIVQSYELLDTRQRLEGGDYSSGVDFRGATDNRFRKTPDPLKKSSRKSGGFSLP